MAAAAVGATTLGASLRGGGVLLAFYLSSSKLTRLQEERKAVDDAFRRGGQRDWVQVRERVSQCPCQTWVSPFCSTE